MTLQKGDKGQQVVALQVALEDSGYSLPLYGVDGYFGAETESAVVAAQTQFLMDPTGVADRRLLTVLGADEAVLAPQKAPGSGPTKVALWIGAGLAIGAIVYAAKQARRR